MKWEADGRELTSIDFEGLHLPLPYPFELRPSSSPSAITPPESLVSRREEGERRDEGAVNAAASDP
jgi:hypothetical protein